MTAVHLDQTVAENTAPISQLRVTAAVVFSKQMVVKDFNLNDNTVIHVSIGAS